MLQTFRDFSPCVAPSAFVADNASVIGDVTIGNRSSVWFSAVLRGDVGKIVIGDDSNVQDGAVLHCSLGLSETHIGNRVTIGHCAVVHGARVDDDCLIGIHATVLDNVHVGEGSVVAAGAVVLAGTVIPPFTLWAGIPARQVKTLTDASRNLTLARHYVDAINDYKN